MLPFLQEHAGRTCEPLTIVFYSSSQSYWLSSHSAMLKYGNREPEHPGPVRAQHLTAELISEAGTVATGGSSRVALALTLEPGWHVYWVYAGDSGEPRHGEMVGTIRVFRWADAVSRTIETTARSVDGLWIRGHGCISVRSFDFTANSTRDSGPEGARAVACMSRGVPSWKSVPRPQAQRSSEGIFRYQQAHRRRCSRGAGQAAGLGQNRGHRDSRHVDAQRSHWQERDFSGVLSA